MTNENENSSKTTKEEKLAAAPPQLTESDQRIMELEHLTMLQTNTITAFQNRIYTLEMHIVELMSQIEFNNQHHAAQHGGDISTPSL
jgi:hypothetical protein